jgi:hypothetical protein
MKRKMLIDLLIFILMTLLMFYSITGNTLHEIMGILTFVLFIIHIVLNLGLIKKTLFRLKKGTILSNKFKLNIILEFIMLICFIILFISSVFISQYIFSVNSNGIFITIHYLFAYILFFLIIIHILMHLKMIVNYLVQKLNASPQIINNLIIILITILAGIVFYKLLISIKKNNNTSSNINCDSSTNKSVNDNGGTIPTLQEFLSGKHCTGCHNHCALSSIRCNRGTTAKENATKEYNNTYNAISTSSNTITSENNAYSLTIL